ncbi:MAG: helix-turn-helix protein [Sphingomonas bacterium]|jgi:AraC-like DNA-binding protein|nr:helix-turn-helix domain-containing protein [Sphingomonas bacterium]MDB5690536.1 helix-turn-helix protein [Sphingomonas bacterium]
MAVIEHFATAGVRPWEQLPFWNRLASETFSGLSVDCSADGFPAEMMRWSLGSLTMIRPRSPAAVVRNHADARRTRSDRVILHLQHRGRSRHSQLGREVEIDSGDLALCASDADYRVDLSGANDMLVVELPRHLIAERVPDQEAIMQTRIAGAAPASRILHDFLLSLWRHGDQADADPAWQDGVVNVFADLLGLALRAQRPEPRRLDARLLALVEAQLGDPALRTATLAAALGVSTRSVQTMFAAIGATPSGYILDRRLDRAADRLVREPAVSITAVAFDLGFNDSAYFARCFRRRFGTPPSLHRARR